MLDINLGGVFLCSQAAAKVPTGEGERDGGTEREREREVFAGRCRFRRRVMGG